MLLWQNFENWMQLAIFHTARKTIFFSGRPTKMVFLEKLRWNMIFLVLSGKVIYPFPEKMILHLWHKMKNDLSKKYMEIWYFLQAPQKDGLSKRGCAGTWSFLYYLERWFFFFREHDLFSSGRKRKTVFPRK